MCLKFNTASLSLSCPPSTVVTGSFRQRNYSIYPKVADFADKNTFKIKQYSIHISNECNMEFRFLFNLEMIQYLYLPHVFRLVVTIHCCKTAFCALWLYFSALSRIEKRLSVFSKIDLFNGTHGEETDPPC